MWLLKSLGSIAVLCLVPTGEGSLTAPEWNGTVVAVVGDDVTFVCQTDDKKSTIRWNYYRSGGTVPFRLYSGEMLSRLASVNIDVVSEGRIRSKLVIDDVRLNNSGVYECLESVANDGIKFHLIVSELPTSEGSFELTTTIDKSFEISASTRTIDAMTTQTAKVVVEHPYTVIHVVIVMSCFFVVSLLIVAVVVVVVVKRQQTQHVTSTPDSVAPSMTLTRNGQQPVSATYTGTPSHAVVDSGTGNVTYDRSTFKYENLDDRTRQIVINAQEYEEIRADSSPSVRLNDVRDGLLDDF